MIVYVAAFCPNMAVPSGGDGGFEWRKSPDDAAKILALWIEEDCALRDSRESLTSDYVFRAVRIPDDVTNDVTTWLDAHRDLWETIGQ